MIVAAILCILVGLGLLLYPAVSDFFYTQIHLRTVGDYKVQIQAMDDSEIEAMLEAAEDYNKTLVGRSAIAAPENMSEYNSLLAISDTGIMGYVQIPKINVSLPLYHGTETEVLQIGAGHLAGSSLPVGGESTHSVITGHSGLTSSRLFTDLDKLKEGDRFSITVLNRTLQYEVDQILVVLPSEVDALLVQPGKDYCTLVTCTPYGVNTHRLLVRGHRVADVPQETDPTVADIQEQEPHEPAQLTWTMIALAITLFAAAAILVFSRQRYVGKYCKVDKKRKVV